MTEDPTIEDEDGHHGWSGLTSESDYHRHTAYINPDGTGYTDVQKGHRHQIFNVKGLSKPIADITESARTLRRAQEATEGDIDPAYSRQIFRRVIETSSRLVGESQTAAGRSQGEAKQLYRDLASTMEDVQTAAEAKKLDATIDKLCQAQAIVNDVAIARFVIGPPIDQLRARMPQYGRLSFLDRAGLPTDKGVNVGNEWTYRSYIEGGTGAAAIWTFENITPDRFSPDNPEFEEGVPLDLTLRVFRTYKGDIEKGILGRIQVIEALSEEDVKAGKQPLVSEPQIFYAQEFTADRKHIPYKIDARYNGGAGSPQPDLNLCEDFAHEGRRMVRIQCEDRAQYFGAAKPDVYVWTGNNYFFVNFAKGYCTIWFQMVLVICFGVLFSTFLSGPVAMLATAMSYVTGYFAQFISDVTSGELEGGGPLESMIRLFYQKNTVSDLGEGASTTAVYGMDSIMLGIMTLFSYLMPDYGNLQTSSFVAEGYNIPPELMTQHMLTTLAYFLVVAALGYMVFKSREVAA